MVVAPGILEVGSSNEGGEEGGMGREMGVHLGGDGRSVGFLAKRL